MISKLTNGPLFVAVPSLESILMKAWSGLYRMPRKSSSSTSAANHYWWTRFARDAIGHDCISYVIVASSLNIRGTYATLVTRHASRSLVASLCTRFRWPLFMPRSGRTRPLRQDLPIVRAASRSSTQLSVVDQRACKRLDP